MAKPFHCFYRLMTANGLVNATVNPTDVTSPNTITSRLRDMSVINAGVRLPDRALTADELLFRIPLVKPDVLKSELPVDPSDPPDFGRDPPEDLLDVTIHVNVGMRYTEVEAAEAYDPKTSLRITFMIVEQGPGDEEGGFPRGMGFQIRDPREFEAFGPYRGVEGRLDDGAGGNLGGKGRPAYIPDDRGELAALERLGPDQSFRAPANARREAKDIPERFEITLKPNAWWGRCATSVAGGHTVSVAPFFNSLDVNRGLYLDIYGRKPKKNFYEIKFIEVSIYR